jgi:hypothetical protein
MSTTLSKAEHRFCRDGVSQGIRTSLYETTDWGRIGEIQARAKTEEGNATNSGGSNNTNSQLYLGHQYHLVRKLVHGAIDTSHGSCHLECGENSVLCGVQAEIVKRTEGEI